MKRKFYCVTIVFLILIVSLRAQDYLIDFTGEGASETVTTVIIENLNQGTSLTIDGNEILHLMKNTMGSETLSDDESDRIKFYPNPMQYYSRMQFALPKAGETVITLFDLSGVKVAETCDLLARGNHIYRIEGVEKGIYFVRISSGKCFFAGKLISSGPGSGIPVIVCENTTGVKEEYANTKSTSGEKEMQYNDGEMLKLTGISDDYSTVVIDIPAGSGTITFNFVGCTDGDGNNYPVVRIGEQTWMAENLRTAKYYNGDPVADVTDPDDWLSLVTGAFCSFKNDISNSLTYGYLYNFYSVEDSRNICPAGWHVPSEDDWDSLSEYLGGDDNAGGKLKETGTTLWLDPNTNASNQSGFSALPGGIRSYLGVYYYIRYLGYWWSSTNVPSDLALSCILGYDSNCLIRYNSDKRSGYSVRCIKND